MKTTIQKYIETLKSKIPHFIITQKDDILLALLSGFIFLTFYSIFTYSYNYSITTYNDISNNLIRFHVLANSDSAEDQALKIYVKDMILEKYRDDLLKNEKREDAIDFFSNNLNDIEDYAKTLVTEKGYSYDVKVVIEEAEFPTKQYNDITLPSGTYLAVRVLIGDHEGQNFWCVLYPPLCYVEATDKKEFDDAKNKLENSLSEDEFLLISDKKNPSVKVKFKMVEFFNSL